EEELRLKDLAVQWHCAPSEIMRHALAQFHPGAPPSLSIVSETAQYQHSSAPDMTQIQPYLQAELPGMVRQCIEQFTIDTLLAGPRYSDVPDDELIQKSGVADIKQMRSSDVPEMVKPGESQKRGGRPRSPMGQRILDLLAQHPEGLTAE